MSAQIIGLSLVIQAGGLSKRMGNDKGLLGFLGQPLVLRLIERLSPIADEVLVTTNNPDQYHFLGVPLASDLMPGMGALGGLYTALAAAHHPAVAIVACDMPFANSSLLKYQHELLMENGVDLVMPRSANGLEPFHAVYRREVCLPHVRTALLSDQRRVDAWFKQVRVHFVEPDDVLRFDPERLAFMNVNTLDELYAAEQIARNHERQY